MAEVFRGWKRKLGVVLLLLSCAMTSLWMSRRFDEKAYQTRYYDVDEDGTWNDHEFDQTDGNNIDPRRASFNYWQLGLCLCSGFMALCAASLILPKPPASKPTFASSSASKRTLQSTCFTSLILCAIGCGWLRSFTHRDSLSIQTGFESSITMSSISQSLCWSSYSSWDYLPWNQGFDRHYFRLPDVRWKSELVTNEIAKEITSDFDFADQERWQFWGFDLGHERGRIAIYYGWQETLYVVPYWAIAAIFAAIWGGPFLLFRCPSLSNRI